VLGREVAELPTRAVNLLSLFQGRGWSNFWGTVGMKEGVSTHKSKDENQTSRSSHEGFLDFARGRKLSRVTSV
jgi:hypothetical protein